MSRRRRPASSQHGGWTSSSDDLEEVLRFAADAITVQAPDGRLVYANDAAARLSGFGTAADLLAAPIDEIAERFQMTDEDGRPLALDRLPGRRALNGEAEPAAVIGFRLPGRAEPRWSLVKAAPVMRDGQIAFVINAFQDVTALKKTESRLRLLADAGAVLGASMDYQATLQSLAELVVPALADWCVVDIAEIGGLRRVAVAHPDPAKRRIAEEVQERYPPGPDRPGAVAEVIKTGETQIITSISREMLSAAARDPEHLALIEQLGLRSAAVLPLVARGEVLGAMTLASSDSGHRYHERDRRFLEDLARRAALAVDNSRLLHEANEAIRLRDDFLAMASHDMRTPLGAILANTQLAQRRLARVADAPPEITRNLENVERTTTALARLVAELMDVAMVRSGQALPFDLSEFDLVAVLEQVAAEHRELSAIHTITIQGEPALIGQWDTARIERVLSNLVENAVKYSPEGGPVELVVRRDDGAAVVSVTDRGIGIPENELEVIFQPYRRASNARGLRGIGLGLAGARDVVKQLGGDLTVESTEGQGATFTLRIPLP